VAGFSPWRPGFDPCEIFGRKSGTGTGFSQTSSVFRFYYNTIVSNPFSSAVHVAVTRWENRGSLETFQKAVLPPKFWSTRQKITFTFRASKNDFL
jgi:hypothetical protein